MFDKAVDDGIIDPDIIRFGYAYVNSEIEEHEEIDGWIVLLGLTAFGIMVFVGYLMWKEHKKEIVRGKSAVS